MEWGDVWRRLFPRRMIEPDVRDEIAFHIRGRVAELVGEGWDEEEAMLDVLQRFGDVRTVEEACRAYDAQRVNDERWRGIMEGWMRDAKLALRSMRRHLGFTAVVVTTLALGIGAATAVFSVVEGILLRPLPFPEADRLAVVWQNDRATGTVRENASTSDYYDYIERNRSFESLGIFAQTTAVLTRDGADPAQLNAALVSRSLGEALAIDMQWGRNFTEAEDLPDGPTVVALSDRVWRDSFGADPSVLGSVLTIDDLPYEVVAILPKGLDYPRSDTDVWIPIQQASTIATRPNHWVTVVGRLAGDATVASAQADMTRIMADLEVEFENDNQNRGAFVEALTDVGRGDLRLTLWVLFGAVLTVLAIACANVANLLLARGATRTRELAVLTAVGAGARQITRKFLVEGTLIAALSGAFGVLLAVLGVRWLTALAPPDLLLLGEPEIQGPVLGFALLISAMISVGFAVLPTLQARRLDVQAHLRDGRTTNEGRAGLGLRRWLVAGQLAMAVMLLLGAGLLVGTLRNIQALDPGFRAESTLRVDFVLPTTRYPRDFSTYPDWPEVNDFLSALEARVLALPGVAASAIALNHPLDAGFTNSFRIEGRAFDPTQGEMTNRLVTPSYFETTGLELEQGRLLDDRDRTGAPLTLLLNREAADRFFPDGDAIGSRIAFWGPQYREVVGIVDNERIHGLTSDVPPAMYVSIYQAPPTAGKITLLARTEVPPLTLVEGVRSAIRAIDPGVPLFNVATMEATLADAMSRERFASTVLGVFAGVALLLSVLGVHGVLTYLVAQRGHEVGVRMALGATRGDVVGMVMRQGAVMTGVGVVVGLAGAVAVSGWLRGLLYGVSATSPQLYVGVAVLLAAVAMGATALPAYRAGSIDPVDSLRGD